jgi:hypothetical protein
MPNTFIQRTGSFVKERSSSTVTAYFRDSSNAAAVPTTVHYRIDDVTGGINRTSNGVNQPITDWTSVTPAVSVDIVIKSSENRIESNGNARERRQITVSSDKGTDTETRDVTEWFIENIGGYDETL